MIHILPVKRLTYSLAKAFDLESSSEMGTEHLSQVPQLWPSEMLCPYLVFKPRLTDRVSFYPFVQSFTLNTCEITGKILTFWVCRDNFVRNLASKFISLIFKRFLFFSLEWKTILLQYKLQHKRQAVIFSLHEITFAWIFRYNCYILTGLNKTTDVFQTNW